MEVTGRALTEETRCTIDALIPLDANGRYDDFASGEYGYQVFCDIDKSEAWFAQFGLEVEDNFVGGQIELSVDKDGNINEDGEVLLWITTGNEEDGYSNEDFAPYNEAIPQYITELIKEAVRQRRNSELLVN